MLRGPFCRRGTGTVSCRRDEQHNAGNSGGGRIPTVVITTDRLDHLQRWQELLRQRLEGAVMAIPSLER